MSDFRHRHLAAAMLGFASSPGATVLLGALVGILTWPGFPVIPQAGLDPSWNAALSLAAEQGLDHGTEFVFTYGPLGFLQEPVGITGLTSVTGGIYALLTRIALGWSVLRAARLTYPLAIALPLTLAVAMLTPSSIVTVTIALALCMVILQADARGSTGRLAFCALGAFAALQLLIKLSLGPVILLAVLITAVTADRGSAWRNLGAVAAGFVPTIAVLWIVSGQGIANVTEFVESSREVISGYSEALGAEAAVVSWDRPVAAVLIVAALIATVLATRPLGRLQAVGAFALVGLVLFLGAKQGFVRHDVGHIEIFVAAAAAPWLLLRWRHPAGKALSAAALVAILALAPAITARGLDQRINLGLAFDQLKALLDPGTRELQLAVARDSMRDQYDLDAQTLDRIGSHSVHVSPWETSVVLAYGLDWEPLPVFQDYQAYTAELDLKNAEALASAGGAERVLRHLGFEGGAAAIDNRYPSFDSPATTRAMLCNFRSLRATARYQVLGRTEDGCGAPRELGSIEVGYGEAIRVPPAPGPRDAVFADVDVGTSPIEALRSFVYRSPVRVIYLDQIPYRLIADVAQNGLLLSLPRSVDFPAPFTLAPNARSIGFDQQSSFAAPEQPIRVSFFAVRVGRR